VRRATSIRCATEISTIAVKTQAINSASPGSRQNRQ
jgi:hypothetical protein